MNLRATALSIQAFGFFKAEKSALRQIASPKSVVPVYKMLYNIM
jgi:hypothetical protein